MSETHTDIPTELLQRSAAKWDAEWHAMCAIEEMSELTKQLIKLYRGKSNHYDDMVEEVADVLIKIEQLIVSYKIPREQLDAIIGKKLERLKKRIGN